MLRDAGCSGCRLTAAVDAIDAAMLELPHDHRCVGQMPSRSAPLRSCVQTAAHELLELDSGRSFAKSLAPAELWGCSEGQWRAGHDRARATA